MFRIRRRFALHIDAFALAEALAGLRRSGIAETIICLYAVDATADLVAPLVHFNLARWLLP